MTKKFITNQGDLLKEVIDNILPSTEKLYILVGYFYFSGFEQLYEKLEDKEVKILIGLDVEKDLLNKIKEVDFIQELNISRGKIRDNFNKSMVSIFNDTDYFDSEEKQKAFRLFLKKIKDGTLEIKKTAQSNHAKLYIFKHKEEYSQGGVTPGTVITGSSNFTRSGLKGRCEINVILRDEYDDAYKIFENLWNNAVDIVNKSNINEFLSEVIEKIWLDKLPRPFLVYIRVLEEFYSFKKDRNIKLTSQISKKYLNLKYQLDAIEQALRIIEKHSGVIIADVVGLGKSIISSVVAHNLRSKTIVIAPPHLFDQWEDFRFEFDFNAKVFSSGKIEDALKENDDDEEKLIIIDEAHKYRNEETQDYANLHKLCQGNKVMLLTATPFSNRPQDIFSMIKLFQIVAKSTIQTVDNLSYQFRQLIKEYKSIQKAQREKNLEMKQEIKELANKIRAILWPVVIRRSRLDLEAIEEYKDDLKKQRLSFPKVNPPELLEYDLGTLSKLYIDTLEKISPEDESEEKGFLGARYKPVAYLKDIEKYKKEIDEEFGDAQLFRQSQINLAKFMRRLLVRRFESSVYAFKESLDSIIESSETILTWYNKLGKVPIYKKGNLPDIDSLIDEYENDLFGKLEDIVNDEQLKRHYEKGLKLIDKKEIKKQFVEDVEKDISLLKEIKHEWFKDGIKEDPKLEHFKETITGELKEQPNRKILVYTEFADTAEYLYKQLPKSLKVFKYTSADANKINKKIIKQNFDAGAEEQRKDYDVLIATDAISEGFNLHRAGTVFNYDIPYNPTRVIQRVGRINRINKKVFDELFIYNFFPTATGEKETRIKQIITLKIALIHALLGEDTKVLTSDEELQSFYKKEYLELEKTQEELSWDVEYRNLLNYIKLNKPKIIDEALKIPKRTRIRRTAKKDKRGVVVFARKGNEYTFKYGSSPGECSAISQEQALNLFKAEINEKPDVVSQEFEKIYQHIKNNLFLKQSQVPYDKGKKESLNKILVLKEKLPEYKDYFEDLQFVLEKLDSLPAKYAKQIRAISEKKSKEDVGELRKDVPHKYLMELRQKATNIEDEEESLIISEELI